MKVKMFEEQFNFGSRIIQTKREPSVEFPRRKIGLQDVLDIKIKIIRSCLFTQYFYKQSSNCSGTNTLIKFLWQNRKRCSFFLSYQDILKLFPSFLWVLRH